MSSSTTPAQNHLQLRLPPELIDNILGFLHHSRTQSHLTEISALQACSTALETFDMSELADRWLWRDVGVYTGTSNGKGRGGKGEKIMKMSASQLLRVVKPPSLLMNSNSNSATGKKALADTGTGKRMNSYIQTLRISLATPSIIDWFMSRSLGDSEAVPLLLLRPSISPGTRPSSPNSVPSPLLPSLRGLILTSRKGEIVPWSRLDDTFRRAFVERLRLSEDGIQSLKIRNIEDFPVRVLEVCEGLKKLYLEGRFDVPNPLPTEMCPSLRLKYLSLHHISSLLGDLMEWLTTPPQNIPGPDTNAKDSGGIISALRTLSFRSHRSSSHLDFTHLPKLLAACKETLEELDVDWGREAWCTTYDITSASSSSAPIPVPSTPASDVSLLSCFPVHVLSNLKKLTIHTSIHSSSNYMVLSEGDESILTRRYRSSFLEIGDLLKSLGKFKRGNRHGTGEESMEVELKLSIAFDGPDAPALREVSFEPLCAAFSSGCKPSSFFITLNVASAKRNSGSIPFQNIREDLEKNEVLNRLVKRGVVRVCGAEGGCQPESRWMIGRL